MITENDKLTLKGLDIKAVAERLGLEVRQRGNSRCFNTSGHPNGDRNPSLSYDTRTGRFKCFACGVGGDTVDLVKAVRHIDNYGEACRELANLMGVQLEKTERRTAREYKERSKERIVNLDYEPNKQEPVRINKVFEYEPLEHSEIYQAFYDACEPPSDELKAWWQNRGLSLGLLKASGWRTITPRTWAKIEKTYNDSVLVESGLKTPKNGQLRHIFWGGYNVAVPFFNGELVSQVQKTQPPVLCLRARDLNAKKPYPKYISTQGLTPTIYGYNRLYSWLTVGRGEPLYITESETDALAIRELELTRGRDAYAIALTGASKNENSLVVRELLTALQNTDKNASINIVTDNDEAGNKFCEAISSSLLMAGFSEVYKWQNWLDSDIGKDLKDVGELVQKLKRTPNG